MKIRIEVSSLASSKLSGIANYTKLLTEALDRNPAIDLYASYFNFLNRQPTPSLLLKQKLEKIDYFPLRIYAKLQSFNIAPPFDFAFPKVDLTIFPNFATWPTIKSGLRATVIHDLTYLYYPDVVEEKNLKHLRRVIPRSILEADFIITISEAVKSEIVKEFAISPEKCIITPIPPDQSYYIENNNEIHKKYNIPTQKFIYFIGNLEPRKDLPTLIEAYIKLPSLIKNEYSLVLAGGHGWKTEKSLKAIESAQKAGENVIHVGFVDSKDASAFYQHASIFVMPSIYEGFGMPILEAMASNCPVITSDIPVLREVAGNAAIFAEVGNGTSFSNQIKKLLNDQHLQNELIKRGKKRLESFSWNKNVETILRHTSNLIQKLN